MHPSLAIRRPRNQNVTPTVTF